MHLYLICLLLISTIGQSSAQRSYASLVTDIFDNLSEKIFGKIWKFDQYCNDFRNSSVIEQDDLDAELFYNGTKIISSFSNLDLLNQSLDDLNYEGIKARKSIAIICSFNSWGYSNERHFELSNQPFDNEAQCKISVDDLYKSFELFENIYNHDKTGRTIENRESSIESNRTTFKQEVNVSSQTASYWQQLNTFGRAPSGSLNSVFIWPGDYDNCVRSPSTRYCFAAYRSKRWPNETKYDVSYAYKIGVCLPRSCNSRSITSSQEYSNKIDQLIRFNLINSHGIGNKQLYKLIDLHCPPAHDSLLRSPFYDTLSTILMLIAIFWFALIIYATIEPPPREAALLSYFDVKLSWKNFLKLNNRSSQLEGINALKNLTMIWLVVSHMYLLNLASTSSLLELRNAINTSIIGAFILQGQHAVPPFFIISGLLAGYKQFSSDDRLDSKLKFILHRYIRLLPMYLLVYAYVKKFGHLLNSGPLWDYGISDESEARQCIEESWFVPILMLANFIPPPSHCILTGWHIANDFQIYLLLPFLLKIYQKSRLKGILIAILSFIASHFYHIWNFYSTTRYTYRQFAHEPFIFGPTIILGRLAYDYVNPFGRLGTYFLGVALADLLLNTKSSSYSNDGTTTNASFGNKEEDSNGNNIKHEEDRGTDKVLPGKKRKTDTIESKKQQQQELRGSEIGSGLCSVKKNIVGADENNNECQDNKLLVNLSTDHNSNDKNASNITTNNYQRQQTNQLPKAEQLVSKRENKLPVCCPLHTTNTTDQQAQFKDIVLFFLGFALVVCCVSMPTGSEELREILGPFGKSLSYPLLRFVCEIGWAMIIYSILAKRSPITVELKAKTKFDKKTLSVTTSLFEINNNVQESKLNNEDKTIFYNLIPGLGLSYSFFKLPIWNILVKVNYTFILVHFTVIRYIIQSRRQLTSFSWYEYNQLMLYTIMAAYSVSLFIYLTVETPLNLIVNRLVLMFKNKS